MANIPTPSIDKLEAEPAWIEWTGGDCPVPYGTLVEVQHRHGGRYYDHALVEMSYAEDWAHDPHRWDTDSDIIAYRVVAA